MYYVFLQKSAKDFFALHSLRMLLVVRVTGIQFVAFCMDSIGNLEIHFSSLDADEKI